MGIVVGAVVVRDGLVLAAQRTRPPAAAGRWELPGGGVEAGETEPVALARECSEELDIGVTVGERFGPDVTLDDGRVLRVYLCTTCDEPTAREHAELRWLDPARLDDVDWLPADRTVLTGVLDAWLERGADAGAELRRRAPS